MPVRIAERLRARRSNGGSAGVSSAGIERRLTELEEAVQECRALNVRLAELTDVVAELLLPVAARDESRIDELLEKYRRDFS